MSKCINALGQDSYYLKTNIKKQKNKNKDEIQIALI